MQHRYAIVAVLTVVAVGAAIIVSQQRAPETSREKPALFPQLAERINDVSKVVVRDAQNTLTVQRVADNWGIAEADNYPALLDKVKEAVLAVADLKVIAEKTDNPALYERLGVEDIDRQGATSTLLTLVADDEELAGLIVGDTRRSSSAAAAPGLYVRIPGQQQALLVAGRLTVSADIIQWLQRDIINIEGERVSTVRLRPAGATEVILSRDKPADDLVLQDLPEGKEQQSEYVIGRMATVLENVYADGVSKADNIDFSTPAATLEVTTFDGLTAVIEVAQRGAQPYARFAFAARETAAGDAQVDAATDEARVDAVAPSGPDADSSPETDAEAEQKPTPAQEAAALNNLLQGWAYRLSTSKAELYTQTLDDLVREPEPEPVTEDAEP